MMQAKQINECLHAYGIHSTTLQPELISEKEMEGRKSGSSVEKREDVIIEDKGKAIDVGESTAGEASKAVDVRKRVLSQVNMMKCRIACGTVCEGFACCAK